MKYIKNFESHIINNDINNNINYDEIQKKFINKFIESKLEINAYNIYAELELLKQNKYKSLIYYIVEEYLKDNDQNYDIQNIMRISMNFFKYKYSDIINKYKEDKKKEFDIKNDEKNGFVYLPYNDEIIKVPSRIGHKYIPIKILPIDDIHTKYSRHKRLKTFHEKGLKCVNCDKIGKYLIAAKDKFGAIHIDLYTKDFELMTIDHIKPKSLGGTYDIENLNPMCQSCNTRKGNKW